MFTLVELNPFTNQRLANCTSRQQIGEIGLHIFKQSKYGFYKRQGINRKLHLVDTLNCFTSKTVYFAVLLTFVRKLVAHHPLIAALSCLFSYTVADNCCLANSSEFTSKWVVVYSSAPFPLQGWCQDRPSNKAKWTPYSKCS